MAKSNGDGKKPSKSAAIREALAQNPQAGSKEIVALLATQGVKVAPTLVYYIKSQLKHTKRKQNRLRAADKSGWSGAGDPVALIGKVKALAAEAGGINNLKRLVDVLAE